jgi:hypothetical protein
MSPTQITVARMQGRNRDRYMHRLALPDQKRDAASALVVLLCVAGVVSALFLGWAVS